MMLTVPQVAEQLNIPLQSAYRLVRLGILPAARLGRTVRIDESRLREWIAQGGTTTDAKKAVGQ